MPGWITHLDVATKIYSKIEVDKNEFLIGNVMPDCERYVVNDFSIYVSWNTSHFGKIFNIERVNMSLPDIELFLKTYANKLNNPVVLGYLSHLLTDKFWNKYTFLNHAIVDKYGDTIGLKLNDGSSKILLKDEIGRYKHNDFNLFQEYLNKKDEYNIPEFSEDILKKVKEIKEVPYKKEDIIKIINYLKNQKYIKEDKIQTSKYIVFTDDEIKNVHNACIDYVFNSLNNYMKK